MTGNLSPGAKRIQDALASLGSGLEVIELPHSTRSAAEAAAAIGCTVGQIAKSIVFRTVQAGLPILVIASGANRINEARIAFLIGEPIEKADAGYVREKTGFAIGGIPPVGHAERIRTIIDQDLLGYREIWAAAGNPNAVFRLDPARLPAITGGTLSSIR